MKIENVKKQVNDFLTPLGYQAYVEKENDGISIEPNTKMVGKNRKDFFDGLRIMIWKNGDIEVAEYQAGKNKNELHIYKETKSLTIALKQLIKGNKQKAIKIWK